MPVPSERLVNRIRRDFSPDRAEEVAGWLTVAAEAAIGEVIATGEAILTRLAAVSRGGGRVVMTTVYDPSDGTGKVASAGLPPWPEGPALVRALNAALTDLAQRHRAIVADVDARFLGHGVHAGDPAQPDARPTNRQLWCCGVIEPQRLGRPRDPRRLVASAA